MELMLAVEAGAETGCVVVGVAVVCWAVCAVLVAAFAAVPVTAIFSWLQSLPAAHTVMRAEPALLPESKSIVPSVVVCTILEFELYMTKNVVAPEGDEREIFMVCPAATVGFVVLKTTAFWPVEFEELTVTFNVPQWFDWSQTVIVAVPIPAPDTVSVLLAKPVVTAVEFEFPDVLYVPSPPEMATAWFPPCASATLEGLKEIVCTALL
jgi:hypothetical protein